MDISYTDPNQNYVQVQLEPLQDEGAITASGVVRAQTLDLKWTQTNSQASRLGYRAMQRLNPSLTGSFSTGLSGLRALGERWVRVQYPFVSGLQDDVIEIQPGTKIDLVNGRITFKFNRISEDDIEAYDPDENEIPQPPVPPFVGEELILKREDGSLYVREDGFALLRE
ncbi:hypothetical protein X566_19050 [Afipia sp. P52-10]|uniref:hypothetical protein n=1 Tax=Afipia sp. P52-10 TaxID=1429916 RepID=UPI0003DF2160|nr:hypothetical protein [Afipia sp. P52-10]ETR75865.1 hypothetical protein X566_19050 [Afipia sp. P52-10]